MAERQWGGKRTPRNPAPVSGPGQLSRRTDGGPQQTMADMTGMPYGENAEFNTLQSMAPMSAAGQTTGHATARQQRGGGSVQASPMVPLFSPTQRPDEPLTAGAPFGPGDGSPMSMNGNRPTYSLAETLEKLVQEDDDDGEIYRLYQLALSRGW